MPTLAIVLAALAAMLLVLAVAMSRYGAGRDVSRVSGAAARAMKRSTQYDVGLMRDVKIVGADGVPVAMHRDLPLSAMGAVPTAEALEACRTDPGCVLVVANESMPFPGKGTRVEPVEVAPPPRREKGGCNAGAGAGAGDPVRRDGVQRRLQHPAAGRAGRLAPLVRGRLAGARAVSFLLGGKLGQLRR